jgi:ethanolamine permease
MAFLLLRKHLPHIERPFKSPVGVAGAWTALVICLVTMVFLFLNPDYNKGVIGAAIWYFLGMAYFAFYARKHLVKSPEEEFALNERAKSQSTP